MAVLLLLGRYHRIWYFRTFVQSFFSFLLSSLFTSTPLFILIFLIFFTFLYIILYFLPLQMVCSCCFLYVLRHWRIISFIAGESVIMADNSNGFVPLRTLKHTLSLAGAYLLYMVCPSFIYRTNFQLWFNLFILD